MIPPHPAESRRADSSRHGRDIEYNRRLHSLEYSYANAVEAPDVVARNRPRLYRLLLLGVSSG